MNDTTFDLRLVGTPLRLSISSEIEASDVVQIESCYQQFVHGQFAHGASEGDANNDGTREDAAIEIGVARDGAGWAVSSPFVETRHSDRIDDLLPLIDEQVVLALQHARPERLFLHAAVLELDGRGILLLAESGAGKSTTCLGLVRSGLGFFSDELAPLDTVARTVTSFPRALCLKKEPPEGFREGVVEHRGRYYVPVPAAGFDELDVATLLFVRYDTSHTEPRIDTLSPAEATLRLAAQGLNLLAHDDFALDPLAELATAAPAYQLDSARLTSTCELVLAELAQL